MTTKHHTERVFCFFFFFLTLHIVQSLYRKKGHRSSRDNFPIPTICKTHFHAAGQIMCLWKITHHSANERCVRMFISAVDRLTILILHLGKHSNIQESGLAKHFNTGLTFSGAIYKCLSFAGLTRVLCTFHNGPTVWLPSGSEVWGLMLPCPVALCLAISYMVYEYFQQSLGTVFYAQG